MIAALSADEQATIATLLRKVLLGLEGPRRGLPRDKCVKLGERPAARGAGMPGVAAVAALPDLPVGEPGEQAAVGGGQSVGHRRQRIREPAAERRPRLAGPAPVDARLRVTSAVRGKGPVLAETYQRSGSCGSTATDHV